MVIEENIGQGSIRENFLVDGVFGNFYRLFGSSAIRLTDLRFKCLAVVSTGLGTRDFE